MGSVVLLFVIVFLLVANLIVKRFAPWSAL
jgi:hypothetical protein